jgi:drug/metabolite transporter (DMT)-like permease
VSHPSPGADEAGESPRPTFPFLLTGILAVGAVSTASIFIRFAQEDAPSLVIAAYRLGLSTLILLPVVLWRGRAELARLSRRDLGLALGSGTFLALHFTIWITSLEYTSVASSVVLVCTSPLFVALIAPLALREPLARSVLLGVLVAIAGGAIVALSDVGGGGSAGWSAWREAFREDTLRGDLMALLGALMVAGYFLIGRRLRENLSLLNYVFLTYGTAAVLCVFAVPLARQSLWGYPARAYLWFALLALVPQLLGHSTLNWALRYLPAANVSLLVLGEPVGTIVLALIFLREAPGPLRLAGAALTLVGIYVGSRGRVPVARA